MLAYGNRDSIKEEIGFERLNWFICGYLHPPISGNIFPCSFLSGWWLVGRMLVCWITLLVFPSHGLYDLCLSVLSHSSLGEGILSCLVGCWSSCVLHLYICFPMFLIFWKSPKRFLFLSRQICNVSCFVLALDIITFGLV